MAGLICMLCCLFLQQWEDLRTEVLPWEQLREKLAGGGYRAIERAEYGDLLRRSEERGEASPQRPWIRRAEYQAEFRGGELSGGQLTFQLYDIAAASAAESPPLLGRTNLQQLQLQDPQGVLPSGADLERRLYVLKRGVSGDVRGRFGAQGVVSGGTVVFRLELPTATTSQLQLTTPADIQVTGSGCLVTSRVEPAGGAVKVWTLVPADPARLTFTCRRAPGLAAQDAALLTGFNAWHSLQGDLLSSRWTVGVPTELAGGSELTLRLSRGIRVLGVAMEDNRELFWESVSEGGSLLLRVRLPAEGNVGAFSVQGVTVIEQQEGWNLPALVPDHWKGSPEQRGPLLTPAGPVTVTLPTTLRVDAWDLKGMQERDVIAGPDMSQTFQLLQFQPEATAYLRTSTNSPQLSETIVHLAEVSGQAESVRSYVNLACAEASVVQAAWPVTAGWDVISVRYASSGRPLLFELFPPVEGRPGSRLEVYFPETLEAGSSRVLEILLQRSEERVGGTRLLQLPLAVVDGVRRGDVYLLWGRGGALSAGSAAGWSVGRSELSLEEFRGRVPWFPVQWLTEGLRCCLPGTGVAAGGLSAEESAAGSVEHEMRVVGNRIREESRIRLPGWPESGEVIVQFPLESGESRVWRVGETELLVENRGVETGGIGQWREYVVRRPDGMSAGPVLIVSVSERDSGPRFVAGIPRGAAGGWPGVLRVPAAGALQLVAENLERTGAKEVRGEGIAEWLLPGTGELVTVRASQHAVASGIVVRNIRQYHLLQQTGTESVHDVLGVLDLDATMGRERFALQWGWDGVPQILVNGLQVRGEVRGGQLQIPLPSGGGQTRVLLLWTERGDVRLGPEWPVRLRRMKLAGDADDEFPGSTVHAVVSPDDLQTSGSPRAVVSGERAESLPGWRELLTGPHQAGVSRAEEDVLPGAAGLRQFVSRWQLSVAEGHEQRLYVDSGKDSGDVELRAALKQRSAAAAFGAGLVSFGLFLGLAGWLSVRLPWASLPVGFSCVASLVADDSVPGLVIRGSFWGSCAGLLLVLLLNGGRRAVGRLGWQRGFPGALLLCALPLSAVAQETTGSPGTPIASGQTEAVAPGPAILEPASVGGEGGLIFVREDVLKRLGAVEPGRAGERLIDGSESEGLIQSVKTRVLAEAADRVELVLEIEVSAASGGRVAEVRLPLDGNRLVSCELDGVAILPEIQSRDQLVVRLPPSVEVAEQSLVAGNDSAGGAAATADERAAFTSHRLECHLWPLLSRQSSVVQFRLPGLPCPRSSVEIVSPAGLYSGARLQTADGVLQWDPASGAQELNSLSASAGAELRLLQAGLEKGVPEPARVDTLLIGENTAGLQQLSMICRFRGWNPLKGELRYRVPASWRLTAVTALEGLGSAELLWSLQEQQALISLPSGNGGEFVLQLQLTGVRPVAVNRLTFQVGETQQFADCIQGRNLLVAIRNGTTVSAAAVVNEKIEAVAFSSESEKWGTWLRRTDTLLRAPGDLESLEVRLDPRSSEHELRMSQVCTVRDKELAWSCRMDVETSQVPVFRHRIEVPAELRVTDVEVTAGEANRLQSWHRRGDQLTVQLREGTTGLHGIELRGRMELRPDDSRVRVASPRLQNSQVLESLLTLTDETTVGLRLEATGKAVPLQTGNSDGQLRAGEPFRLQLIEESDVVVLERLNPVEPNGRVAVLRTGDRMITVLRLSNWSSRLGPLQMQFAPGTEFVAEPIVVTERGPLTLVRNDAFFESGPEQLKELFGISEFMVAWSAKPVKQTDGGQDEQYPWPRISDQVVWTDVFSNRWSATDGLAGAVTTDLPEWAGAAAEALGSGVADASLRGGVRISMESVLRGDLLVVPRLVAAADGSPQDVPNGPQVHIMTAARIQNGRPTRGTTSLLILARRYPVQLELEIPDSLVLEQLPAELQPLPQTEKRGRYGIELVSAVTRLELRWLSRGRGASLFSPEVRLELPHLEGSRAEGVLRLMAPGEEATGVQGPQRLAGRDAAANLLTRQLLKSLKSAGLAPVQLGLSGDVAAEAGRLSRELLHSDPATAADAADEIWFQMSDGQSLDFTVRQRLHLQRILTAGIGLLMCASAVLFASPGRGADQRSVMISQVQTVGRSLPGSKLN
ncbi:MAG: hypothetical protein ACKO2P_08510 [Planctomycetota bacterium]